MTPALMSPTPHGLLHGFVCLLACAAFSAGADTTDRGTREAQRNAQREAQAERRDARRAEQTARREAAQNSRSEQSALCAKIVAWLTDTDDSHIPAAVLAGRFGGNKGPSPTAATRIPYESWLFQDARFEPAFGQRFDAVDPQTRRSLQRAGNGCTAPRNARNQAMADNMLFFRAFDDRYYPRYTEGVIAIRTAHASLDTAARALATLPATDEGLQQYREHVRQADTLSPFMTQEMRLAQQAAVLSAYQRVAEPIHQQRAKAILRTAQGPDGLKALVEQQRAQASDARTAGASSAVLPEVRARQQALAQEAVVTARRDINALGKGLPGLVEGAAWYQHYQAGLGTLADEVSELAVISREFLAARAQTWRGAQQALETQISAAQTPEALQSLLTTYLPLPEDATQPGGVAVLAMADRQRQALHKQRVLGTAAIPTSSPAGKASPATGAAEPTASDMYDAMARAIASHNTAASGVAAQCNNRDFVTNNDPVLALQCLQYGIAVGVTRQAQDVVAPRIAISRFEKIGCEKAQGEPGYRCDYVAGITSNMALPASLQALYQNGAVTQARFVAQPSGWLLIADR